MSAAKVPLIGASLASLTKAEAARVACKSLKHTDLVLEPLKMQQPPALAA